MGEHADLSDVVGVHDGHGVGGVDLGARLIAEDPEGQHRGADRAVIGNDRGDQRAVRSQIVGVEVPGLHRRGTGGKAERDLLVEPVGGAGRQDQRRPGRQPLGKFDTDLAAATQNQYWTRTRVVHGCDYHLR